MSVAIIDYGSGNLRSAAKAFERAVRESGHGGPVAVTDAAEAVAAAERIVLPGVGAFADCMAGLAALPGMVAALREAVIGRGRPFLGICVGMQLMARRGYENGEHDGLGWIAGEVRSLADRAGRDEAGGLPGGLRIPHMGWNELAWNELVGRPHPLLAGVAPGSHAYFVHSYHLVAENPAEVVATTDYGGQISAIVGRDNMVGTQFHPEKSQSTGLALIANFLKWRP